MDPAFGIAVPNLVIQNKESQSMILCNHIPALLHQNLLIWQFHIQYQLMLIKHASQSSLAHEVAQVYTCR